MKIIYSLPLVLAMVCLKPGLVSSVRIEIKTIKMDGWVLNSANISCLADNVEHHTKQIASIQLIGPGNAVIASIDYNSTIFVAEDLYLSKMEVAGHIAKETWKSYLTVVMSDILISQSGMYVCKMHYFDREGILRDDVTSNILDAGKQDVNQVMAYMMSKISYLEDEDKKNKKELKELKVQARIDSSQVSTRLDGLQALTNNQSIRIGNLDEKDAFMSAFSVGYNRNNNNFIRNDVLKFKTIHFNIGDDYNEKTGQFTAPRSGYYVFHLVVMANYHIYVDIVANNKPVAQAFTNGNHWEQASATTIVKLQTGHVVKPVVSYVIGTNALHSNPLLSEFTGYLIKAS